MKNKPVIVLEVGGLKRNLTFKIGINGVNRDADFAQRHGLRTADCTGQLCPETRVATSCRSFFSMPFFPTIEENWTRQISNCVVRPQGGPL